MLKEFRISSTSVVARSFGPSSKVSATGKQDFFGIGLENKPKNNVKCFEKVSIKT